MDLRPRYLMWVDILMFFVGFGLVFAVAYAWAADDVPEVWEDRLAVSPPGGADRSLSTAVATALKLDTEVGGFPLQVSTANAVVRLTGVVPSGRLRDRAARLALETPGVAGVENHLRIDPAVKRQHVSPEDERAAAP